MKMTSYPLGSLREVGIIALPLMLTNLSNNLMLFLDRLILAHYSTTAMNAAITIGMTCSIFLFAMTAITATAEIFVGRYNGSQENSRVGQPVWQMLWFSLLSIILFAPLALFGNTFFVPTQYAEIGTSFYRWYMLCGPIFPIVMALTSFYIGRGKVKLITLTMILGNGLNLLLAVPLILGISGFIPALGMKGAAIATLAAQVFQASVLFLIFINKHNRKTYGTGQFYFHWQSFLDCLKVGIPMAIGYIIEVGAWAILLNTLTTSGNEFITVFAIGQSLFVLFAFLSEGMQKSVTVLTANLIGAQKWLHIPTLLRSAIKLQLLIGVGIFILIMLGSDWIIATFTSKSDTNNLSELKRISQYALLWFWLFFICDGIKWIIGSTLIALKKTTPVMLTNFFSIWFFAVIPIYFAVHHFNVSPLTIWQIVFFYSAINMVILLIGYWYSFRKLI